MLVTHANIKGFGLTPLSEDRRGYMPPLLKNKQKFFFTLYSIVNSFYNFDVLSLILLHKRGKCSKSF